MTETPATDSDLVESRAQALTPEERQAGVDDPEALAKAVLAESEDRTQHRSATTKERRRSEDTVEPPEQRP